MMKKGCFFEKPSLQKWEDAKYAGDSRLSCFNVPAFSRRQQRNLTGTLCQRTAEWWTTYSKKPNWNLQNRKPLGKKVANDLLLRAKKPAISLGTFLTLQLMAQNQTKWNFGQYVFNFFWNKKQCGHCLYLECHLWLLKQQRLEKSDLWLIVSQELQTPLPLHSKPFPICLSIYLSCYLSIYQSIHLYKSFSSNLITNRIIIGFLLPCFFAIIVQASFNRFSNHTTSIKQILQSKITSFLIVFISTWRVGWSSNHELSCLESFFQTSVITGNAHFAWIFFRTNNVDIKKYSSHTFSVETYFFSLW